MSELRIADWEYLHAEQFLLAYLDRLAAAGAAFGEIMGQVRGYAVDDDVIAPVCEARGVEMAAIANMLSSVRADLTGKADALVSQVDGLDEFIY
ncbi:MAG: hypothetical protein LBK42_00050 [Propionibacteriaceae bacterium]|nr:hypothetical protein [Propionibacteriaceae bacterium]